MNLKPKSADIILKYECPQCGCSLHYSYEEVKFCEKTLCGCGYKIYFEPIQITLKAKYNTVDKDKNAIIKNGINKDDIILALCNLGYSKKEASIKLSKIDLTNKTEQEIIQECL